MLSPICPVLQRPSRNRANRKITTTTSASSVYTTSLSALSRRQSWQYYHNWLVLMLQSDCHIVYPPSIHHSPINCPKLNMPELQFIIASPQSVGSGASESQRTIAHSHAARSAHARKRRLQTIQYQAQKRQRQSQQHSSLVSILPATRADPFMSFARSLNPVEPMLFDHCMSSP